MTASSAGVAWLQPSTSASAATSWGDERIERPAARAVVPDAGAAVAALGKVADGPEPTFVAAGAGPLRVEGRLGHAALPAAGAQETFVYLDVSAPEARDVESRAPVNVSIVLDRSGSMRGQRMTNALAAVRGMFAQLRPDDVVSLVAYDDEAEVLLSPAPVRSVDAFTLGRALDGVRGRGHTCISCGIEMARSMIRRREGAVNRILLLSDGEANRGIVDAGLLGRLGDAARREGAAIASIGVDVDYDERTLLALSEASNGRHYFVDGPAELQRVFEDERRTLVASVADRVDVDIRLAEGVELLEVVDRPHRLDGEHVQTTLGTIAAGEQKTVLLRVRVAAPEGVQRIADVQLAYRDLLDERDREEGGELGLRIDSALARAGALDPTVEARLGRKETFDALIAANAAFARGDVAGAERELDLARGRIKSRRRRSASVAGSTPTVAEDFDRQLQVLGGASSGFIEAARNVPVAAVPSSRPAKAEIRKNAASADPFSN